MQRFSDRPDVQYISRLLIGPARPQSFLEWVWDEAKLIYFLGALAGIIAFLFGLFGAAIFDHLGR